MAYVRFILPLYKQIVTVTFTVTMGGATSNFLTEEDYAQIHEETGCNPTILQYSTINYIVPLQLITVKSEDCIHDLLILIKEAKVILRKY